jgi:membrane-bound metal-dependent hydrolase YbcI (DUF457 family)
MKGIAHFISGVTAASFCPWAVKAAMDGNPLYFVLGGVFGILPDTIDFKFYRFFYPHDVYIEPDPRNFDPQAVAETLARTVEKASAEKRTYRIKLCTVRAGADLWQQYDVQFNTQTNEVIVTLGPVVNTGQVPVPGSAASEKKVGRAKVGVKMIQTYDSVTHVDIFDGPSFSLQPDERGAVELHFLPWHRNWSHSFTLGAVFAALGWLIWDWRAAVVIFAGMSAHLLEDQMGLMGSNLFFPFTKRRMHGLHLMRSGDAIPNFVAVWTCCLLIFWNLYRFLPNPVYQFSFWKLVLYGAVIPLGGFALLHYVLTGGWKRKEEGPRESGEEFDNPVTAS